MSPTYPIQTLSCWPWTRSSFSSTQHVFSSSRSHPIGLILAFFRDDPTPSRGSQIPRASSLIFSSLGFIHDLRTGELEPDTVRGVPLDMSQYERLFGTARVPTDVCGFRIFFFARMNPFVIYFNVAAWLPNGYRRQVPPHCCYSPWAILWDWFTLIHVHSWFNNCFGLFGFFSDYFDVLDSENRPVLTERDITRNLEAIVTDADNVPVHQVASQALGVLTTENRKTWSQHRDLIQTNRNNAECLSIVE